MKTNLRNILPVLPIAVVLALIPLILSFNFIADDLYMLKSALNDPFPVDGILVNAASELYRPLVVFSFYFNYMISGYEPWSYYMLNVALHFINIILLYFIGARVFDSFGIKSEAGAVSGLSWKNPGKGAVLLSILFMVYPHNLMDVFWISGRTDILAGVFVFSALLLFMRYLNNGKIAEALTGLVLLLGGALSKETWLIFYLYLALIILKERSKLTTLKTKLIAAAYLFPGIIYWLLRSEVAALTSYNLNSVESFIRYWVYGLLSLFLPIDFLEIYGIYFALPVLFAAAVIFIAIAAAGFIYLAAKSKEKIAAYIAIGAAILSIGIYFAGFPQMRLMYLHLPLLLFGGIYLYEKAGETFMKKVFSYPFKAALLFGFFLVIWNISLASKYSEVVYESIPDSPSAEKSYVYPVLIKRIGQTWCLPDIKKMAELKQTGSLKGKENNNFTHLVELSTYWSEFYSAKVNADTQNNAMIISTINEPSFVSLPGTNEYLASAANREAAFVTVLEHDKYRESYFNKVKADFKTPLDSVVIIKDNIVFREE